MRFALLWPGILLGAIGLGGCAAKEASALNNPTGEAGSDTGTTSGIDATIAFEGPSSLEAAPAEVRELSIVTYPPAPYDIYFTLIDAPSDASLDASYHLSDADGRASVKLHAPGMPATFTVRAAIKDGPSAELSVSVTKTGTGSVRVIPEYDGDRPVESWVASIVSGTTCDDLGDVLPGEPQGALVAIAPDGDSPVIQSVPVGPKLAVTVRAGHYAWGCIDSAGIPAGTTTKVKVHVVDVPAALDRTDLAVTFAFNPKEPYGTLLMDARAKFLGALFPPETPEPVTLLDTMGLLAPDPAAFSASRESLGWDAVTADHFTTLPQPIAARTGSLIDSGLELSPPELTGQLTAIDGVEGKAIFFTSTVAGLDAESAGAPLAHLMSWTSQPNDQVVLSGSIFWVPSRFIGAACRAGAEDEVGAPIEMAEILASAAACDGLAASFGGLDGCDATCLEDLCRAALAERWLLALDASAVDDTACTTSITASGKVSVDDTAMPIALSGTWLGQVSDGVTTATAEGAVTGVIPDQDMPQDPPAGDPPPQ